MKNHIAQWISRCLFAALIIYLPFAFAACADSAVSLSGGQYAHEIVIQGLAPEEFTVSVGALQGLEAVTRPASARRSNGQTVSVNAVGPLLETWLAPYGKSQKDFSRIRFSANDGYSIAVSREVLENREIILALFDGKSPLSSEDGPVRVIIPGERAMYWVRQLSRISFESGTASARPTKLILLEEAAAVLPQMDYEYYGAVDKAVTVSDLFSAYAAEDNKGSFVSLLAADGLEKNETEENFLSGMIKYSGADSPRFVSDLLPAGMHTRSLVWIAYGDTMFISLPQLLSLMTEDGRLDFSEMLRFADVENAASYRFTFGGGIAQNFAAADLAEAYFTLNDSLQTVFSVSSDARPLNGLLSIEALN
jgi:hypothetical protein